MDKLGMGDDFINWSRAS